MEATPGPGQPTDPIRSDTRIFFIAMALFIALAGLGILSIVRSDDKGIAIVGLIIPLAGLVINVMQQYPDLWRKVDHTKPPGDTGAQAPPAPGPGVSAPKKSRGQRVLQVIMGLLLVAVVILDGYLVWPIISPPPTSGVPTSPVPGGLNNLDDRASQWAIFLKGGNTQASLDTISNPSLDGKALKISLGSGDPYTDVHAYLTLPAANAARAFQMTLSFYFTPLIPVQALEFSMSTWVGNQRWEWAIKWDQLGEGSPQLPPAWRLWTGTSWQDTGVRQPLNANSWHSFSLSGNISQGQVRYLMFRCDDISANLDQSFPPVSAPREQLVVAVQLDGDSRQDPYQVYVDGTDFSWS